MKKECDDFKKHPEYENFIRERMDATDTGEVVCKDESMSTETTRELEDDDVKIDRTVKDDSGATGELTNALTLCNRTLANGKT